MMCPTHSADWSPSSPRGNFPSLRKSSHGHSVIWVFLRNISPVFSAIPSGYGHHGQQWLCNAHHLHKKWLRWIIAMPLLSDGQGHGGTDESCHLPSRQYWDSNPGGPVMPQLWQGWNWEQGHGVWGSSSWLQCLGNF